MQMVNLSIETYAISKEREGNLHALQLCAGFSWNLEKIFGNKSQQNALVSGAKHTLDIFVLIYTHTRVTNHVSCSCQMAVESQRKIFSLHTTFFSYLTMPHKVQFPYTSLAKYRFSQSLFLYSLALSLTHSLLLIQRSQKNVIECEWKWKRKSDFFFVWNFIISKSK